MNKDTLLRVENLKKYYPITRGIFSRSKGLVMAVDGVDLTLKRGETLGLVGESGCGKTTFGKLLLRLQKPTSGQVFFDGEDILQYNKKRLKTYRKKVQIIFQDPFSSLNPRKKIGYILKEPLIIHDVGTNDERKEKVLELLQAVGLYSEYANSYPHKFSGGQKQRIGIARSLALNPEIIVCDEPVSALDVSIQAQILNLLKNLQDKYYLTYLIISHDLSVVKFISDRVAVMYLGKIVEIAPNESLYQGPLHPYTKALLSACPIPDPLLKRRREILEGDVPSPINPPPGCHFHVRCPNTMKVCRNEAPPLFDVAAEHKVRCHLFH